MEFRSLTKNLTSIDYRRLTAMSKHDFHDARLDAVRPSYRLTESWTQPNMLPIPQAPYQHGSPTIYFFHLPGANELFWEALPEPTEETYPFTKNRKSNSPQLSVGVESCLQSISKGLSKLNVKVLSAHIDVRKGGQLSTVFDWHSGDFVGLHIDIITQWGWTNREQLANRAILNLGEGHRTIAILPTPIDELRQKFGLSSDSLNSQTAPSLLEFAPPTEVMGFSLAKNVGCIFPVQNLIHDGQSSQSDPLDIAASFLVS